jgi:hypothetical protein
MAVTPQDLNNTNAPVPATSPYGTGKNSSAPTVRDGTNIDASTFNQNNNGLLVALLRAAGITPSGIVDNADISQVAQAIQSAIAKGNFVNDLTQAGTPNTIVLSSFRDAGNTYNLTHPVAVLQDKQQFRFVAAQTNTSNAVTLQGSQLLVAKNIIGVQAGDISAGTLYIATYNAATDDFTIRPEIFVPVQDNILDNGDFIIAQRGTTFNASTTFTNTDGNYTLDRWKVIDSRAGSDVVDITQTTLASELPAGARAAMKLVHQRQNEQAGIVQYIEYNKTRDLLNQDVSLSFEIYNSDSVTRDFRAAILTWQGTVDDMPNDPVSTWQTAANLGFATNFTTENTTTALTANATSWNRFTINGVNIDTANTNNLAVVIWTDETMANGYEWRVTKAKLDKSSIATAWKEKSITTEQRACKYFYEFFGYGRQFGLWHSFVSNGDTRGRLEYQTKRTTPTITLPTTLANCFATGETATGTNLSVDITPADITPSFCTLNVSNASTVFSGLGAGVVWSTQSLVAMEVIADL